MENSAHSNPPIISLPVANFRSKFTQYFRWAFPPINGKTLLRHYVPLSGAVSHSLFTMHIFAPPIFTKVFSVYDLAASNICLFNSHLGIGFYIFFRPHMHRLWRWRRVEFSVFASVMFNFGSLLLSIFIKDFLPRKLNSFSRSLIGIGLSWFMLFRARRYVHYIDQRTILPSLSELKNHAGALGNSAQQSREPSVAKQIQTQQNGHSPSPTIN